VPEHHTMKVYKGYGSQAPHILNLSTVQLHALAALPPGNYPPLLTGEEAM
jgi:hypothetical protein